MKGIPLIDEPWEPPCATGFVYVGPWIASCEATLSVSAVDATGKQPCNHIHDVVPCRTFPQGEMGDLMRLVLKSTILLLLVLPGCSSPLDSPSAGPLLDPHLQGVIERELSTVDMWQTEIGSESHTSEVEAALAHRLDELEGLTPAPRGSDLDLDLGIDLHGDPQRQVPLVLQDAVEAALLNNLSLQSARLQPAIQREEVIKAEAVFDVVLGAGYTFTKTRTPNQSSQIQVLQNFNPTTTSTKNNDTQVSLSKALTTGGEVKISQDFQYQDNASSGFTLQPNPYWKPTLNLDFSQPILRGFGEKVTLAQIAIARKMEQESIETLRQDLIDTVTATETAYWNLSFAWRSLAIQEWLVEASVELRDTIDRRRNFDASLADWAQAVATVEQRVSEVINFQQAVKEASDQLKVLMNDSHYPLAGETVLAPIDEMVHTPILIDFRDSLLTAIAMRPAVRNSVFEIDIARINELVADNARLPELDFQARVSSTGMEDNFNESMERAYGGDFISYVLGLAFQYPLGNRAAEAGYRQARLQRSASMVDYRQAIQTTILDVKTNMRKLMDNAELISATRTARLATAESLRALEVERDTLASLTPTFLNLLFSTQAQLATARTNEFQAIVNYNTSVAELYQSMGIILDMHQINIEVLDEHAGWGSVIQPYSPPTQ